MLTKSEKYVGMVGNVQSDVDPVTNFQNGITRACLIASALQKLGGKLLIYSPNDVDLISKKVYGFYVKDKEFIKVHTDLPNINYDWFMTEGSASLRAVYEKFEQWANANEIFIYPPDAFSVLARDKYECHNVICKFDQKICPRTERYVHSETQLHMFFSISDLIFLKPQFGGLGNNIIVIERKDSRYFLSHYNNKIKNQFTFADTDFIVSWVKDRIESAPYIIQQGIKTPRLDSSTFDVRVITIYDGIKWRFLHEVRLGARESDLSNLAQGGSCFPLEEILSKIYGNEDAKAITQLVIKKALDLSKYLDSLYSQEIFEIAFDFILDEDKNIYLAEINNKPGTLPILATMSSETKKIFDGYRILQGKYVAEFLYSKITQ